EAIPSQINDVDIDSSQRGAVLQHARTFVDQPVEATLQDFLRRKLSLRNGVLPSSLAQQLDYFGILHRLTIFSIGIPTLAGFLSEATELIKLVGSNRPPRARFLAMTKLLSHPPRHVHARHVVNREDPHGHS